MTAEVTTSLHYLDLLAAAIAYNGMSADDGFEAFDDDEDGVISSEELRVLQNSDI
jgi:hypothetical protein